MRFKLTVVFQAAETVCAKALRQEGADGSEELNKARVAASQGETGQGGLSGTLRAEREKRSLKGHRAWGGDEKGSSMCGVLAVGCCVRGLIYTTWFTVTTVQGSRSYYLWFADETSESKMKM